MSSKGQIYKLLNKAFEFKNIKGDFAESKKRVIKIQLTLKTGLSMNKFTDNSEDSTEELSKIIEALKSPEFGLQGFPFGQFSNN